MEFAAVSERDFDCVLSAEAANIGLAVIADDKLSLAPCNEPLRPACNGMPSLSLIVTSAACGASDTPNFTTTPVRSAGTTISFVAGTSASTGRFFGASSIETVFGS